ncbi:MULTISPECIES: hypothetical protein [unclassified Arthrobacter]|uniref:hypothetical protein n=1 Tax=unclassified Arthrobacter TaxID=235627 RepID=UPI0011AFF5BA|nr:MULTISPECIES: hypothetical protein [unclassified Arthrobacter]
MPASSVVEPASLFLEAGCRQPELPHYSASSVEVHRVLRMATRNVCVETPGRSTVVAGFA